MKHQVSKFFEFHGPKWWRFRKQHSVSRVLLFVTCLEVSSDLQLSVIKRSLWKKLVNVIG